MSTEPSTNVTPASILEDAEKIPEASHEEVAHALGRLLAWILEPGKMTEIGERALIVAYKVRPDLIEGATLHRIAKRRGSARQRASNLAKKFTMTFGLRGLNGRTSRELSAKLRAKWFEKHPDAPTRPVGGNHLVIINRLTEWRARNAVHGGPNALPPEELERLRKELAPMLAILKEYGVE